MHRREKKTATELLKCCSNNKISNNYNYKLIKHYLFIFLHTGVLVIVKISYSWLHAFTLYNSVVLCMVRSFTLNCFFITLKGPRSHSTIKVLINRSGQSL